MEIIEKVTYTDEAGDIIERITADVEGHDVQIIDINHSGTYTVTFDDKATMVQEDKIVQWIYNKLTGY